MADLFNAAGKGDLSSDDWNYFQTQKRRVNQTFGYGLDQNQWQRDSATNDHGRKLADLKAQWGQMRAKLPSPYAGAGLLNSGIYARGLDTAQADFNRAQGDLAGGFNDQLAALGLADRQLESVRGNSLNDLDSAEVARRAAVAEALRSIS